jgi:hypothetical protein
LIVFAFSLTLLELRFVAFSAKASMNLLLGVGFFVIGIPNRIPVANSICKC